MGQAALNHPVANQPLANQPLANQPLANQPLAAARYRCPCCGSNTIHEPAAMELCPVCWWEDDGQEDSDASEVRLTVNGDLSLTEARANYQEYGASHPRYVRHVRHTRMRHQDTEE